MNIKDIINKKREKKELSEEEIRFFIFKYFKEEISEEQASALLTLIYTNGITQKEMTYLTNAMAETGEELEVYKISNKIIDFHPIGGMQDKIIIVLISIIASLNIPIVKISSRELGLGDRLSSIPNYHISNNLNDLHEMIKKTNIGIIAEPINFAPVEEKLYKLRNSISCNDDISLIAMSLMSQKIAIGAKNILFNITCGENAYVKTYANAKKISEYMNNIGKAIDRNVKCVISDFIEPVGRYFGNILEIEEVVDILHGKMTNDIQNIIIEIGTIMLQMIGFKKSKKEYENMILNAISSGQAYTTLLNFLKYQNIDVNLMKNREKEKFIVPIISKVNGYIEEIDISKIRDTALYLNAIKSKKDDILDIGAGISFFRKVGDKVYNGETLGYIHTNNEVKISKSLEMVSSAYRYNKKKITRKSGILGII